MSLHHFNVTLVIHHIYKIHIFLRVLYCISYFVSLVYFSVLQCHAVFISIAFPSLHMCLQFDVAVLRFASFYGNLSGCIKTTLVLIKD